MEELEQRSYRGNSNIKMSGVETEWTPELIREYQKCMNDPIYFIENYMKVLSLDEGMVSFKMYDYQRKLIDHYNNNRFSITLACRQSGKCPQFDAFINVRNKKTGEICRIKIGDFYKMMCEK